MGSQQLSLVRAQVQKKYTAVHHVTIISKTEHISLRESLTAIMC